LWARPEPGSSTGETAPITGRRPITSRCRHRGTGLRNNDHESQRGLLRHPHPRVDALGDASLRKRFGARLASWAGPAEPASQASRVREVLKPGAGGRASILSRTRRYSRAARPSPWRARFTAPPSGISARH
jgi:hypothetical protein